MNESSPRMGKGVANNKMNIIFDLHYIHQSDAKIDGIVVTSWKKLAEPASFDSELPASQLMKIHRISRCYMYYENRTF